MGHPFFHQSIEKYPNKLNHLNADCPPVAVVLVCTNFGSTQMHSFSGSGGLVPTRLGVCI